MTDVGVDRRVGAGESIGVQIASAKVGGHFLGVRRGVGEF